MAFNFYYDELINNNKYTYRLLGQKSGTTDGTLDLIVRDLIREPLSISIAHSYSGKSYGVSAAYANLMARLADISTAYEAGIGEQIKQAISNFQTDYSNYSEQRKKNLNYIDYAKEFQGTEVTIPISLNARLYARKFGSSGYKTSTEQVNRIMTYFMGEKTEDNVGIKYTAPHNFQIDTSGNNVIDASRGTLGLMYGETAVISNLILTNAEVTMSKELTNVDGVICPLYANLSMTLAPAFAFTINDISQIFKTDAVIAAGYNNITFKEKYRGSGAKLPDEENFV